MKPITLLTAIAILLSVQKSPAGDAVAIGYNSAGVWTAVTYYCSGTVAGGKDYQNEAGARAAALRDLKKRAGQDLARESILSSSDKTAFFAYGRGKTEQGKSVHAVSSGTSTEAAEKEVLRSLASKGARHEVKVVYRYHSFGANPYRR